MTTTKPGLLLSYSSQLTVATTIAKVDSVVTTSPEPGMTLSSLQILYGLTSAINAKNKSLFMSYLDPEVQVQSWCPFPLLLYGHEGVGPIIEGTLFPSLWHTHSSKEHLRRNVHLRVYFDEAIQVNGKLTAPLTLTSGYLPFVPRLQEEGVQARVIIELNMVKTLVKFIWFKIADPDRELLMQAILPPESRLSNITKQTYDSRSPCYAG